LKKQGKLTENLPEITNKPSTAPKGIDIADLLQTRTNSMDNPQRSKTPKPKQKQLGKTKGDLRRRARRIVKGLIEGKSETEVLRSVGYSNTSALNGKKEIFNNPVMKKIFTEVLEKAGLSDAYLAERIKQLSEAKETKFFQEKGIVIETREVEALGIQSNMIEFATKLKGHLVEKHIFPDEKGRPQRIDGGIFSDPERAARLIYLIQQAQKRDEEAKK